MNDIPFVTGGKDYKMVSIFHAQGKVSPKLTDLFCCLLTVFGRLRGRKKSRKYLKGSCET